MPLRQALVLIALAMLLCACGRQDRQRPLQLAQPAPAPASGGDRAQAAPPRATNRRPNPRNRSRLTRLNDDGSETVEETTGDSGVHNPLLAAVASTVAAATASAAAAARYQRPPRGRKASITRALVPAQPTSVPAGQVEVLEFFWYACPHCYALDPLVARLEKDPSRPTSASRGCRCMWNEGHRSLARLFYTLQSMGKLDQLHDEVFKEIHVNGNPLIGSESTAQAERAQVAFIKKLGISETDFEKAYHSFEVENSLQRADELVQRYRITGVPTFVVNGKYIADVGTASCRRKRPFRSA